MRQPAKLPGPMSGHGSSRSGSRLEPWSAEDLALCRIPYNLSGGSAHAKEDVFANVALGLVERTSLRIGVSTMPIRPYLAGQAFEPEIIKNMSAALAGACDALQLKMHDDPATRFCRKGHRTCTARHT